jgi:small subunit ribosomal protein S20
MPNIKSAAKRMRSDAVKRTRNQATVTELKSLSKKLLGLTDPVKAKEVAAETVSKYDRAVSRGIIPKGRANRKKSRVALFLNRLQPKTKAKKS